MALRSSCILALALLTVWFAPAALADGAPQPATAPAVVYVPYRDLQAALEAHKQGVFLPYDEFQRLWQAAQRQPAALEGAPAPYLISTARLSGRVDGDLASLRMQLTIDLLSDQWVQVPLGLAGAAVVDAKLDDGGPALIRVVQGQYWLAARGPGRRTLDVQFVRQLVAKPGLNVLSLDLPASAIATLDLLIPQENLKVEVKPLLAATTAAADDAGKPATRLQAFLGSSPAVELSWKPKAQADPSLEPVLIAEQEQHIFVDEALVRQDVSIRYDVRLRGLSRFVIQVPADYRLTACEGADINRWDVAPPADGAAGAPQILTVELFSPVVGPYALSLKMEQFVKDAEVVLPLEPVLTQQALRQTGLVSIAHAPRRSVELRDPKGLARVDAGRLPEAIRSQPGVLAYRFISPDYGGKLAIGTVQPRISVDQFWALGVGMTSQELRGRLNYHIDRAGVFELRMSLPQPWQVVSVGPAELVDSHELIDSPQGRQLKVLLRKETTGEALIELSCRSDRARPDQPVALVVPAPDGADLQLCTGRVVLQLADSLRAQVDKLDQLQPCPLDRRNLPVLIQDLPAVMAFQYKALDVASPAGAAFGIAVKPSQVSAVADQQVTISPGMIEQVAIITYNVQYAPVDTFYVKVPPELADGLQLTTHDMKERMRLDALPPDQAGPSPATAPAAASQPAGQPAWVYYKVVLQSPVTGQVLLTVYHRRDFKAVEAGQQATAGIYPILAAGKLAGQSGHVTIATADTLAVGEPTVRTNLEDADPTSEVDVPEGQFRRSAVLAFRFTAPTYELSLPVVAQKEAAVFTTIASAALVEQVIGRDGTLNGRVCYAILTSRGDRLPIRLPAGARLYAVSINGVEAPVEAGAQEDVRIVRLPPSAGQTARLILEISYGQDHANPSRLTVPMLSADTPVQQTLWRVYLPPNAMLLGYDRNFAPPQASVRQILGGEWADKLKFTLAPQGTLYEFVRQGPPGELAMTTLPREGFAVALWAAILALGAALLWVNAWPRLLAVLGVAVVLAVVNLTAPLWVAQILLKGVVAGLIVLALWLGQAILARRRRPAAQPVSVTPPLPAPPTPSTQDKE